MFERLLEPGCTESPTCHCGGEMQIAAIEMLPQGSDAAVRIYAVVNVSARCALQSGQRPRCKRMVAFSRKLEARPASRTAHSGRRRRPAGWAPHEFNGQKLRAAPAPAAPRHRGLRACV
jgi:hypothetical protein